jgi:hypothetical protein
MAAYKLDKGAHAVYTLPSGGENVKGGRIIMKSREQYIRPYLDEANRRYDEMIDELVSKYKTDVEEEED